MDVRGVVPRLRAAVLVSLTTLLVSGRAAHAQAGRIFNPTPETTAIWEFNDLPGNPGDPLPDGTGVPDVSGNGLNAVVEAGAGSITRGDSDPLFDPSTSAARTGIATPARIAVNNDRNAFEFGADDDFSVELYVRRAEVFGGEQWGILAGTWHSRTLLDDSQNPDANGAWYGYGFIRRADGGWLWVGSPINADGTFTPSFNEVRNDVAWDIPAGSSYIVASVDRVTDQTSVYLNGELVETVNLPDGRAFITPTGYEHARFLFLTGEDDASRGAYRAPPTGFAIDAARVQRRTIGSDEARDNWIILQDGSAVPPAPAGLQAIITASAQSLAVDQCTLLSGANSAPGAGNTITRYEWKIGDGPFEEGGVTREVSFPAPSGEAGVEVSLRVTNSASATSTASLPLFVEHRAPIARIGARLGDQVLSGANLILPIGAVLSLDGSGSFTPVPPGAFICPIAAGNPLPSLPITEYHWMANEGGINVDDTRPAFNLGPLAAPTQFHLNLSVRNSAGQTGTAAVLVKVVDPGGNSQVFHTTDATLLHLEMNGLEPILPGETGDIRTVPDLSGNGLDAVIVDPFGASFQVEGGAPHLASNEALAYTGGGSGPRGEVRDDGGAFEFGVDEDFSFEIYVRPADSDEPAWGDVAGTFRARVVEPVQFTERYGWGIIKAPEDGNHCFVLAKGIGQGGEFQVHSRWNKGEFNYVACVVERGAVQTTSMYVNGALVSRLMLDPSWTFETPVGFPAATFYLFTREQTPGEFHNCVPGTAIDAVRVQDVALSEETIAANWANICAGLGSDPPPPDEGVGPFRHGDCNQDGSTNLTDGIFLLNFLFLGGTEPGCPAACNNNGSGSLNITTAVFIFNFLFLGGPAPPDPRVDCGFSTAGGDVALGCPTPGATACP